MENIYQPLIITFLAVFSDEVMDSRTNNEYAVYTELIQDMIPKILKS